jgi:hypothetical protein
MFESIKIISGGQTGADQAALDVAIKLGLDYGGSIPKGRLTEDGPLDQKYDKMIELTSKSYRVRTEKNIIDSDGTLIFTINKPTGGTALTEKYTLKFGKPCYVADFDEDEVSDLVHFVRRWINNSKINVLNVAGPRASEFPEIYKLVFYTLKQVCIRYSSERKPSKCPNCGGKKVASILWGMPAYSEELQRDIAEGKIIIGGCCVSDDDPKWQCAECGAEIYKEIG